MQALSAALISAGMFILLFAAGFGSPLTFLLPTLPLLALAMRQGARPLLMACGAALLAVLALTGTGGAVFFAGFMAAPCLLFIAAWPKRPTGEWLTDLSAYACLACLAIASHLSPEGGLQTLLARGMQEGFKTGDPLLQDAVERLSTQWGFALVALSAWWWVAFFYLHALFARWLLARRLRTLPPLTFTPFTLPLWLLGCLGLSALAMGLGGEIAFAAKISFIILLFPYFLQGLALLLEKSKTWPARGIWLFFIYFFMFSQAWPALLLAIYGLWQQISSMQLDRRG